MTLCLTKLPTNKGNKGKLYSRCRESSFIAVQPTLTAKPKAACAHSAVTPTHSPANFECSTVKRRLDLTRFREGAVLSCRSVCPCVSCRRFNISASATHTQLHKEAHMGLRVLVRKPLCTFPSLSPPLIYFLPTENLFSSAPSFLCDHG